MPIPAPPEPNRVDIMLKAAQFCRKPQAEELPELQFACSCNPRSRFCLSVVLPPSSHAASGKVDATGNIPHNKSMQQENETVSAGADFFSRQVEAVPQRIREIAMLRGLGYPFREIARQYQVSSQAISLMLARHKRAMGSLRNAVELSHLSARAANALGRHGIRSREEAIRRNALDLVRGSRNCGRKTLEEISVWMGPQAGGD